MQFTRRKLMLMLSAGTLAIALVLAIAVQPALTSAREKASEPPTQAQTAGDVANTQGNASEAPASKGQAAEAPLTGPPAPTPVGIQTYTVKEGENLSAIAAAFDTDVDSILALNDIADPETVGAGTQLRVLPLVGLLHRMAPNETLEALAARYQIDEDEIVRVNALSDRNAVTTAQEIIIPGAHPGMEGGPDRRMTVSRGNRSRVRSAAMVWPVVGEISSPFGPRWGRLHPGLDIAAPAGTPIVAATAGTVVFAGWDGSYGLSLVIEAPSGLRTRYGHASTLLVDKGAWVDAGTRIARVGSTGFSTGPHLHFEVIDGGDRVDPQQYLP